MTSKPADKHKLAQGKFKQIAGDAYGTPKEVWGFRGPRVQGPATAVARRFLAANAALFGLSENLGDLRVHRVIRSLGADHVLFDQRHEGLRVHRAYVTVHVGRTGRVYLTKNRAVPAAVLAQSKAGRFTRKELLDRARRSLPKPGGAAVLRSSEGLWYPKDKGVAPAWKFRLIGKNPRQEWLVYVDAATGKILSRYDNLATRATGAGLVFDPSPVTRMGDHATLLISERKKKVRRPGPAAYRQVRLKGLDGSGFLSGRRVSTAPTGRRRIRRPGLDFLFRSHQRGFEEVMVYFHVDAALAYIESLGFRGVRAIFSSPVEANVNGTREDNSFYSPSDRQLTFGTGEIDDAEDAETILHELGHAIQDAICPDFGQSEEAAAMGEGFGDYWAASFFEAKKPPRYSTSVMTWDGLFLGLKDRLNPPCLRRVDSPKTFDAFEAGGDEHVNGEIWSATLWDVRRVLGRQGADRAILESHFQLDGFTTFARGARAILDADDNLNGGRHRAALTRVFQNRRIGPL